jgi:hypothetical protein
MGYVISINDEGLLDMLMNTPLSIDEQKNLMSTHNNKIFLRGIDEGDRIRRRITKDNENYKEKKLRKELDRILEPINDKIGQFREENKYKKIPG